MRERFSSCDCRLPIAKNVGEVKSRSSLRVPRVVALDAFREQTFATALAPAREGGATAFRLHARAKTMLTFARALGRLVGAFHFLPTGSGLAKLEIGVALST